MSKSGPHTTPGLARPFLFACLIALLATGCGRPVLTLDDSVSVRDANRVLLTAHVEREVFGLLRSSMTGVPVRFFAGENLIGEARTDRRGDAAIETDPQTVSEVGFGAWASLVGSSIGRTGRLFEMNYSRVAVIVDVDHTIARTDIRALLLSPLDSKSEPIPGSQAALQQIAKDFTIIYLTGRPRSMQEKTRAWLAANDYPPGPLVVAPALRVAARNGKFKLRILEQLRTTWPNLLVGIGDRPSDAHAYGANGMLTLIIAPREVEIIGPHALLMPNWDAVAAFFDSNRVALTDPAVVRDLVAGRTPLLLRVRPYARPENGR